MEQFKMFWKLVVAVAGFEIVWLNAPLTGTGVLAALFVSLAWLAGLAWWITPETSRAPERSGDGPGYVPRRDQSSVQAPRLDQARRAAAPESKTPFAGGKSQRDSNDRRKGFHVR